MMTEDTEMEQEEAGQVTELTEEEEIDARLATAMGHAALSTPEVKQALEGMMSAAEPPMAAGQMLANLITQMKEQSDAQGLGMSDNIWMAEGGVSDRLSETIATNMGEPEAATAIRQEVLEVLKMGAQVGEQNAQAGAQAPPQAGPVPSGPMGALDAMGGMA